CIPDRSCNQRVSVFPSAIRLLGSLRRSEADREGSSGNSYQSSKTGRCHPRHFLESLENPTGSEHRLHPKRNHQPTTPCLAIDDVCVPGSTFRMTYQGSP